MLGAGWSAAKQAYAQSFDSDALDAQTCSCRSSPSCPRPTARMRSTIEAIARELTQDGLVLRYLNDEG